MFNQYLPANHQNIDDLEEELVEQEEDIMLLSKEEDL